MTSFTAPSATLVCSLGPYRGRSPLFSSFLYLHISIHWFLHHHSSATLRQSRRSPTASYYNRAALFSLSDLFLLTRLNRTTLDASAHLFRRFKLLLSDDPSDEGDSKAVIETTAFNRGVLALPGTAFLPNGRKTAYVRASFSLTPEEDVDVAIGRLRDAILDAKKELAEKKQA